MTTKPTPAAGMMTRLSFLLAACTTLGASLPVMAEPLPTPIKVGRASWYGHEFRNRRTASGDRFDPQGLTGAHRTLPLGSKVRVTNLHNGRSVLVTINDRGPYFGNRTIDLSLQAARVLDMVNRGIARVLIEPLS